MPQFNPTKPSCEICQSQSNALIDLWGYYEHQEFTICKDCLRVAAKLDHGDLLNFEREVIKKHDRNAQRKVTVRFGEIVGSGSSVKDARDDAKHQFAEMQAQRQAKQRAVEQTIVEFTSAGYEWTCPACDTLNTEIEVAPNVTCGSCGATFATDAPEHAYP